MIRKIFTLLAIVCCAKSFAQLDSYTIRGIRYVEEFKNMAIDEQRRVGIPAAITLAQGILETEAGNSELATKAHNHFGIKCRKEWKGETFAHDDDHPQECFRKYNEACESYKDHSDYLTSGKRYKSCFDQSPTNYSAWARELRNCGYATSKTYAQQLIKIIETFQLQQYTLIAMNAAPAKQVYLASNQNAAADVVMVQKAEKQPPAQDSPVTETRVEHAVQTDDAVEYGKLLHKNGLKGFYARKGDVLLAPAITYNLRYSKLLELNDLPDAPLSDAMFIYLEKKKQRGLRANHTLKPGENLLTVAQEEGVQLRSLRSLNQLEDNEDVPVGTVLQLQIMSAIKPSAFVKKDMEMSGAATASRNDADMIATNAKIKKDDVVSPVVEEAKPIVKTSVDKPSEPKIETVKTETVPVVPVANTEPVNTKTTTLKTEMPVKEPEAKTEAPVNIANETAVEEVKQPAAPMDDFERLKAKLDKVVYADDNKKPKAIRPATPVPQQTTPTLAPPMPPPPVNNSGAATTSDYHIVKAGETAFGISRQYNITMKQLMELNGLEDFKSIQVGQKLKVK